MREQGAADAEVESMLQLLRDFEAKCLAAQPPAAPEECKQVRADSSWHSRWRAALPFSRSSSTFWPPF